MGSLITAFILTVHLYGATGDVQRSETLGMFNTASACEAKRRDLLAEPPVGLPPSVGLACVEVQFKVNRI